MRTYIYCFNTIDGRGRTHVNHHCDQTINQSQIETPKDYESKKYKLDPKASSVTSFLSSITIQLKTRGSSPAMHSQINFTQTRTKRKSTYKRNEKNGTANMQNRSMSTFADYSSQTSFAELDTFAGTYKTSFAEILQRNNFRRNSIVFAGSEFLNENLKIRKCLGF